MFFVSTYSFVAALFDDTGFYKFVNNYPPISTDSSGYINLFNLVFSIVSFKSFI